MNLGNTFLSLLSSSKKLELNGENGISSVIDAIKIGQGYENLGEINHKDFIYSLEELGFLYLDWKRGKVRVEPQSLIRSVHSVEEVFLSGARVPTYLDKVKMLCDRHGLSFQQEQYDTILPSRVRINGREDQLTTLANEMRIKLDPVPRAYKESILTIDFQSMHNGWEFNTTQSGEGRQQNPETKITFFNTQTLQFDGLEASATNPYNMGRLKKYGKFYMYKYSGNSLKVAANIEPREAKWYCLSKKDFKLAYKDSSNVFYIPRYCPLPLSFARSLAMCSCLPPKKISLTANEAQQMGFRGREMDFLEYSGIPRVIANIISSKMGMKLYSPL
ncbi:MAG: hypothetical protein CMH70_02040 [Nitrosomonadaceae bacterium]|nr:hypothetical protein [Nitrosomonadaceae bacterium]|tara:strand:- start:1265 stop:2260 length:996 start_codon:yes stop_codon:yes gene_type:complete